MLQFMEEKKKTSRQTEKMPDICGIRLCGYAESFRELARSFEGDWESGAQDRRAIFEEARLRENREVIAGHLKELADIMEKTARELGGLQPLGKKEIRRLRGQLRQFDILLEGVCLIPVCGGLGTQVSLRMRAMRDAGMPSGDLTAVVEEVMGRRFSLSLTAPEFVDRESRTFLFVEYPAFMVLTGFARVVKGNEEISGDNYSVLQSEKGDLTLLLSDGTGSGEGASRGSGFVLDLTEKLLENGYGTEAAMRLVNATALTMGEEIGHPTLDLCRFDLRRGRCELCKAGGAVSFRKRGAEVLQLAGGQLPLGIFQDLEPHVQYLTLQDGDSMILLSDGVLEAFREKGYEEAARKYLEGMEEQNPGELAEKLMQLAIFASEGKIRDDMTILAATIWKNP